MPFGSSVVGTYKELYTIVWRKLSVHINVLVADAVRFVRLSRDQLRCDFFVHLSSTDVDNFWSCVSACLQ